MVAMRTLYEKYAQDMLATSFRMTKDIQLSEDVLQEGFLRSFQRIDQLGQKSECFSHQSAKRETQ